MSGALGYHGGLAAETIVEEAYLASGAEILDRRWRGEAGEIDLIARQNGTLRFIEVKKARSHSRAAERVTTRKRARIGLAAQEYLGQISAGLDTEMQIDVALVDHAGRVEIRPNAFF